MMGDSKCPSIAPRKQSCRHAKRRARALHSKTRHCSLLPACSWLTVTLFFTSARFNEAIIEVKTDPIYPKFAVKLCLEYLHKTNLMNDTAKEIREQILAGCRRVLRRPRCNSWLPNVR